MNVEELIEASKKLSKEDKEKLIIENLHDLDNFECIEEAINLIKNRGEEKFGWDAVKELFKKCGMIE